MNNVMPVGRDLDWELLQIVFPDLGIERDGYEFWHKSQDSSTLIDFRPSIGCPNAIWSLLEYVDEHNLRESFQEVLISEARKDNINLRDGLDYIKHSREEFVVRALYQVIKGLI
jgi:hypothetical protein